MSCQSLSYSTVTQVYTLWAFFALFPFCFGSYDTRTSHLELMWSSCYSEEKRTEKPTQNLDITDCSSHPQTVAQVLELTSSLVAQLVKICLRCRRPRFKPWVGKIPWRRKWQLIPVFLPGKFHGQRRLAGYSPGVARVGHDLVTKPPPPPPFQST